MRATEIADTLREEIPAMAERLRAVVAERRGLGIDAASVRVTYPELHGAAWERALELAETDAEATAGPSDAAGQGEPGKPADAVSPRPCVAARAGSARHGIREHAVLLASVDIIDMVVGQFRGATFADVQDEIRCLVPAVAACDPEAAASLSAECDAERREPIERYLGLAASLDAAVGALGKAGPTGSDTRVAARRLEELSGLMRIPGAAFGGTRGSAPAP